MHDVTPPFFIPFFMRWSAVKGNNIPIPCFSRQYAILFKKLTFCYNRKFSKKRELSLRTYKIA